MIRITFKTTFLAAGRKGRRLSWVRYELWVEGKRVTQWRERCANALAAKQMHEKLSELYANAEIQEGLS